MGIPRRSAGQSTTQLLAMKFLVLLFVAAAFAEPEAEPEADPYLLYGGHYNGLHGGYYNGFNPVYKTIVPATVEKTEEAVVEKSAEPVKKVLSYRLHLRRIWISLHIRSLQNPIHRIRSHRCCRETR